MDERHTPLQCGLDKYCHLDRGLESLSVKALAKQRTAGVSSRLMGVVVPKMPVSPQSVVLRVGDMPAGNVTSHCLSARYDAWLGIAMMGSPAIEFARGENGYLNVETEHCKFNGRCVELPFDFSALKDVVRAR